MAAALLVMCLGACANYEQNLQSWSLNKPIAGWTPDSGTAIVLGSGERINAALAGTPQVTFQIKNPTEPVERDFGRGGPKMKTGFHLGERRLKAAPPGDYALALIHFSAPVVTYSFGGWKVPDPTGLFSVKAGEIIYIGHVTIDARHTDVTVRVEDRFEQFMEDLPEELRPYADRIEKRLITLPEHPAFTGPETTYARDLTIRTYNIVQGKPQP